MSPFAACVSRLDHAAGTRGCWEQVASVMRITATPLGGLHGAAMVKWMPVMLMLLGFNAGQVALIAAAIESLLFSGGRLGQRGAASAEQDGCSGRRAEG